MRMTEAFIPDEKPVVMRLAPPVLAAETVTQYYPHAATAYHREVTEDGEAC